MKKILIVACGIMLCCVMLIPVSASETNTQYFSYNGHELPSIYDIDNYGVQGINFIYKGGSTYILICTNSFRYKNETTMAIKNYRQFRLVDGVWDFEYSSSTESSVNMSTVTYVWSDTTLTDYNGNTIIEASIPTSVIKPCDGSTCPATDANTDNICDDCGAVFAVLRSYDAPDPYTAWTADRQANFPYAFIYKNEIDANVFIMASTRPYVQDGQIVIDTHGDTTSYLKYTQWGNDWRLAESYDFGTTITADTLVSSFNILDTDGNIVYNHDTDFFPVPLWVEMDNLTQGEMVNKLSPTVVGILMTLMVCGVGCLALLAVLKLFGKRSLIFRN